MKRLLLLSALLTVAVVVPAHASAAVPCRNKIFNDWYADGKIASTYSHGCYVDALHHIPQDAAVYSSLSGDIKAAMRASLRRAEGKSVPAQIGRGFKRTGAGAVKGTLATVGPTTTNRDPALGDKSASGGLADSASSAPLPILVLGGLAIALAAAGAIGGGVKYARSRRL
ncbi:MAG TPA: hypothetical protein VF379_08830 [Gaiellaceae bacterium]